MIVKQTRSSQGRVRRPGEDTEGKRTAAGIRGITAKGLNYLITMSKPRSVKDGFETRKKKYSTAISFQTNCASIYQMDPSRRTDNLSWHAEMVVRSQAGDDEAFEALAARYRAAALAVTFLRTGNREEAEDLAQEVLLKARERLNSLKESEAFPGWLRAIALNACRTWYRKLKPADSLDAAGRRPLRDYSAGPLEVLLEKDRQKSWRKALLMLPGPNRCALLMHVWGGYSYQEIADFLDVPVSTVEGRIHRAKNQLRRLLQPGVDGLLDEPRCKWQKESD